MDRQRLKDLLDACFMAKKITETMPELPDKLKPRHIHVIDCIANLSEKNEIVCVSDVSSNLNITTPSVTKLINELETKNIVEKTPQIEDKRVINLSLTDMGYKYYKEYVVDYHETLLNKLGDMSEDQCIITIETINNLYKVIKNVEKEKNQIEQ